MNTLIPILLFVYNRPKHTVKTINTLLKANLANHSEIFIFSDGSKSNQSDSLVMEVRSYIHSIQGFKKIHIIESEKNKGLADSIIGGVNYVFEKYESVITIEDDVLVGKHFLEYMNENIVTYQNNKNVFMISGYLFNLPFKKVQKSNFFLSTSSTQAWATWKDRWENVDFNAEGYQTLKINKWKKFRFNLYGSIDYSGMLISQMEKSKLSSWAIRYRWHLFNKKGLTLFPSDNLIKNIGWDGLGNHCGDNNVYQDDTKNMNSKTENNPSKIRVKKINTFRLILFFYKIRIKGFLKHKLKF